MFLSFRIRVYTVYQNPQINSQDIEHKQNPDVDQGPEPC